MRTRSLILVPVVSLAAACGAPADVVSEPALQSAALATTTNAVVTPDARTRTPIKHAIVILGENRTFDHIFATYKPRYQQKIHNLLSEGIINEDGTPGPNYALATQFSAVDSSAQGFAMSPMRKSLYDFLPAFRRASSTRASPT
jgi:phospholipase C